MSGGVLQNGSIRRGFLSFRQLSALAVIVIFPASGMVSFKDVAFTLFSPVYVLFLSKVAFPVLDPSTDPRVFGQKINKFLSLYVPFTALIGLILPIGYIVEGILGGDKEGIKAAAAHFFLLCSQVFMEGLTFHAGFSIPIFAFVPVFYNSRRIFTIVDWLRAEMGKTVNAELSTSAARRVYFGRALAVASLLLWCFNLFGFLLPVFLPRAFKRYYGYKEKV
ncbi:uncharacterized protein LOC122082241 [Macadamia integrifolia]|uniref:uncharacterized protein LOC122082241 n=1 Tax=Macadamia integrifolia TaxID=60698 RepID=UPI001C4EF63A|nr:uncharacterized protein LOC122082241 [Macadamia integrifolia]